MKKEYLAAPLTLLVAGAGLWFVLGKASDERIQEDLLPPLPATPENATYRVDNREIALVNGLSRESVAPESTLFLETSIMGEPYTEDVNNDGLIDAVVTLTQTTGGSGTFYYIAVALADGIDAYQGSNAILLGDRIRIESITSMHGILEVRYRIHAEGESMTSEPTELKRVYIALSGATLTRIETPSDVAEIFAGLLIYGHEARTFTPCGKETLWIDPSSRALAALEAVYRERTRDREPNTPVYGVMLGTAGAGLTEGLGADYPESIVVHSILSAPADGRCATQNDALDDLE